MVDGRLLSRGDNKQLELREWLISLLLLAQVLLFVAEETLLSSSECFYFQSIFGEVVVILARHRRVPP